MRTQTRRYAVRTARQVDTRRTDSGWDATSTTDPSADIAGTEELRDLDSLHRHPIRRRETNRVSVESSVEINADSNTKDPEGGRQIR